MKFTANIGDQDLTKTMEWVKQYIKANEDIHVILIDDYGNVLEDDIYVEFDVTTSNQFIGTISDIKIFNVDRIQHDVLYGNYKKEKSYNKFLPKPIGKQRRKK